MEKQLNWLLDSIKLLRNVMQNGILLYKKEIDEKIKFYEKFSLEEKRVLNELIDENFGKEYKILLFSLYKDNLEFLNKYLDLLKSFEFDHKTGMMIEYSISKDNDTAYNQLKQLHHRNIELFSDFIKYSINNAYIKKDNKKIVIFTGQIISINHAPTQVVINVAYTLKKYFNYEVFVFIVPVDYNNEKYCLEIFKENCIEEFTGKLINYKYKDEILNMYQLPLSTTTSQEYIDILEEIRQWNPEFVLSMGTENPICECVRNFTKLVSMPMSIGCSVSEADILIRLGKKDDTIEKIYEDNLLSYQKQIFMDKKIPVLAEKEEGKHSREEYNLPNNKFLIAIVGNRLDNEIDSEFINIMRNIAENNPLVAYVIIGKVDSLKNQLKEFEEQEKIYYMGYCQNLMQVYSVIDLYINPKRSGGGFSSKMALIAGVPVITLPDCDVAYNCGEKFTISNYKEMQDTVYQYINNKDFCEDRKNKALEISENNSQQQMTEFVEEMISKIKDNIN